MTYCVNKIGSILSLYYLIVIWCFVLKKDVNDIV